MDVFALLNHILSFVLSLYGDPAYTRKIVQDIIDFIDHFIRNLYLPPLKNEVIEILKKNKDIEACFDEIDNLFNKYSNVLDPILTEKKRLNLLKAKGFFDHEEIIIGETLSEKSFENEERLSWTFLHGAYAPLRKTLKLFLEIPGMFDLIIGYMKKLSEERYLITNIIQADLWSKKYSKNNSGGIVLPFFIFFDDIEVGNALGSHAGTNKFGAVYALIACLPPHIASQLNSILFTLLFRTEDKKKTTNKRVFAKLIEEINFLQREGILINVAGTSQIVKFQLLLILGDNLGLNSILGFTESFKTNFFCRFCKVLKEASLTLSTEDSSILRNRDNYEKDVEIEDVKKTGIKEQCAFHEIDNFHVVDNLSVDVMHDILEGVCMYGIRSVTYALITDNKYFDLDMLNKRITDFDFGTYEKSNKPPIISLHRVKNQLNMKMSAAEMLCLSRYFGLIIGDLVPEDDENWKLYKTLRQILDIVTSPRIVRSDSKVLAQLLEKHNLLYVELFGALKPKFHHLVHYPRILLDNGPCVNFSSMRFESRHRQLKANAENTSSTQNLLKTIATKQILQMCNTTNTFQCQNLIKFGAFDGSDIAAINPDGTMSSSNKNCYTSVEICNTLYKLGTFLVTNMEQSEVEFGQIIKIIKMNNDVYFNLEIYEEVAFDEHYHAYIIEKTNKTILCVNQSNLPNIHPCLSIKKGSELYIATRYKL